MSPTAAVFKPGALITKSWDVFKDNLGPLLGGFVIMVAILSASGVVYFGPLILGGPFALGYYKMVRDAIAGRRVEMGDLFYGFHHFLPAFLAYLLISIFSIIGTLFCIIPGILVGIVYAPVYLFILDGENDFWQAMESSRKMVMENFMQWLLLMAVLFLLNLGGLLLCCVGILVTGPMSTVIIALAYDQELGLAAINTLATPVDPGMDAPQDPPFEG